VKIKEFQVNEEPVYCVEIAAKPDTLFMLRDMKLVRVDKFLLYEPHEYKPCGRP
jgi:hypothetical protein